MNPETLTKLADLKEALGTNNPGAMLERYDWFVHNSEFKEQCSYTKLAKKTFLDTRGKEVAGLIDWLYNNFAKDFAEKGDV